MTVADNLRKIEGAALPAIRQRLDADEELSEIGKAAGEQGIDWSQAKALLMARERDDRDGGQRVGKLISKAENAAAYLAMLKGAIVARTTQNTPQSKVSRETKIESAVEPPAPQNDGGEAVPRLIAGTASPLPGDDLDIRNQPFARAFARVRAAE